MEVQLYYNREDHAECPPQSQSSTNVLGSSALLHGSLGFNSLEKTSSTKSTQPWSGEVFKTLGEAFQHLNGNCGALKAAALRAPPVCCRPCQGAQEDSTLLLWVVFSTACWIFKVKRAPGLENTLQFESQPAKNTKINTDCATVTLSKEPNLLHLAPRCSELGASSWLSLTSRLSVHQFNQVLSWDTTFSNLTALPDSWY